MKKILIISANALGDTYLSASAIEPLKKNNQPFEIHFMAPLSSDFFLSFLPINKIFYLNEKKIIDVLKLLFKIRRIGYDVVFLFFPGLVNTLFFYFSKSRLRIGFPNFIKKNRWDNSSQEMKINRNNSNRFVWQPRMNYLARVSKPLEFMDIKWHSVSKPLFNNFENNKSNISNGVAIHFKASDKQRSISDESMINLCAALFERKICDITLIGMEEDFRENLLNFCKEKKISVIIKPDLNNLLNLILNSKIFVGVDSFPLHIADAYNSRFLGIFGPTIPSSVLVNSAKSIRFSFDRYINIDCNLLADNIEKIYNYD